MQDKLNMHINAAGRQISTCFFHYTILVVGCMYQKVDMIALFDRMVICTDDLVV